MEELKRPAAVLVTETNDRVTFKLRRIRGKGADGGEGALYKLRMAGKTPTSAPAACVTWAPVRRVQQQPWKCWHHMYGLYGVGPVRIHWQHGGQEERAPGGDWRVGEANQDLQTDSIN